MAKAKKLLSDLGQRGPHGVEVGDLGFTGMPGMVFVPTGVEGKAPVVGFAHEWRVKPSAYRRTMVHLASWGFIVVAPAGSSGFFADQSKFTAELSDAIEHVVDTRLGRGSVRADVKKIGLAGHGMGGGVATLLASMRTDISAVASLFPAPVSPPAVERAPLIDAPGLILSAKGGERDRLALELATSWRGDSVFRRLSKAREDGLVERGSMLQRFGLPGPHGGTQRAVRPLLAGFMLATLAEDKTYSDFAEEDTKLKGSEAVVFSDRLEEVDDEWTSETSDSPNAAKIVRTLLKG